MRESPLCKDWNYLRSRPYPDGNASELEPFSAPDSSSVTEKQERGREENVAAALITCPEGSAGFTRQRNGRMKAGGRNPPPSWNGMSCWECLAAVPKVQSAGRNVVWAREGEPKMAK